MSERNEERRCPGCGSETTGEYAGGTYYGCGSVQTTFRHKRTEICWERERDALRQRVEAWEAAHSDAVKTKEYWVSRNAAQRDARRAAEVQRDALAGVLREIGAELRQEWCSENSADRKRRNRLARKIDATLAATPEAEQCPNCKGAGFVAIEHDGISHPNTCYKCAGTGRTTPDAERAIIDKMQATLASRPLACGAEAEAIAQEGTALLEARGKRERHEHALDAKAYLTEFPEGDINAKMRSILDASPDAAKARADHIEAFAAAYHKQTNIHPTEAVLVQENTPNGIRWWFERKDDADLRRPCGPELEVMIGNGYIAADTFADYSERGWRFVVCVPATMIHPYAAPTDKAAIFARYHEPKIEGASEV